MMMDSGSQDNLRVARSLAFCVIFPRSLFDSCCSIFSFLCFPRSLFVPWSLFHLVILLCVLRFTTSDIGILL